MIEVKSELRSWPRATAGTTHRAETTLDEHSYAIIKRAVDVMGAGALLLLLTPLLVLLALAIRLDSPGAALFRQKRVGRWGREFTMFKFRSMYADAGEELHRQFARSYINGACKPSGSGRRVFKPSDDPRVTRVGRWLRRTSLDELPQLVNVLRGEMSLVGPRPAVKYEVQEYAPWHMGRLAVLPGLTGLAQISGRSSLTFDRIVRLDLQYVRRRCIATDLSILLRTVPVVLGAKSSG